VESIPQTITIGELSAEDSFVCGVYANTNVPSAFIHKAAGLAFNNANLLPNPDAGHAVDSHADAENKTDSSSCCSDNATVAQNAAANWKKADMSIISCFAPVPISRNEFEASKFEESANPTAPPNPVEIKDETLMYAYPGEMTVEFESQLLVEIEKSSTLEAYTMHCLTILNDE